MSMRMRSGRLRLRACHGFGAVHGLDNLIPRTREQIAQYRAQLFLVLDDENAFHQAARLAASARTGSSMRKVEPWPGLDSTQMRPPCISTIFLAMASPSPVPPLVLVFESSIWWNSSKILSFSSGGMPGPVSLTASAK